jgi:hypothetical protein
MLQLLVRVIPLCSFYKLFSNYYALTNKWIYFFVLVSLFLSSCSHQLEKRDYIRWVNSYDNGLHVKEEYGDFVFDLQHEPADYHSLVRNDGSTTKSDDLQYYILKIGLKDPAQDLLLYNVNDLAGKQQNLYYYSYLFQNDIFLEEASEKHPCVLFHFEQNDLLKTRTFILGFENSQNEPVEESKLIIQSPQFGSLPVKIQILKHGVSSLKL